MTKRIALIAAFAAALASCEAQQPQQEPPAPTPATAPAAPLPPPPAPAWAADSRFAEVVIDARTGAVIYGDHETEPRHIASLTKIMTAYIVFSALSDGQLTPETRLTVSPYAASQGGTGLGLQAGQTITVDDALNALVTISANDAAVVLAEALSTSESAFAARMTTEAQRLGTLSTTFRSATGLTRPGQISSARDIAIILSRLQHDYPDLFATYFSAPSVDINGEILRNCGLCYQPDTNIIGHKGGFTNAAGRSLAAITHDRNGQRVIVTLGAPDNEARTTRVLQLARYYLPPAA